MADLENIKKQYWDVIKNTRQSRRISKSVMEKEEAFWSVFPDEVVEEALKIHISRYPMYRESYTRGIIRNLNNQKGHPKKAPNRFKNFKEHDCDFDEIARRLIRNI